MRLSNKAYSGRRINNYNELLIIHGCDDDVVRLAVVKTYAARHNTVFLQMTSRIGHRFRMPKKL